MRETSSLRETASPLHIRHRPGARLNTLLFHPERCSGCGLCASACGGREDGFAAPEAARIQILGNAARGGSFAFFCQHCLNPRCLTVCPQGAVSRDKAGLVRISEALCVHCGLCREACAEAAPLRDARGDIRKCDLCGGRPKCVEVCPQKALEYTGGKKAKWFFWLRWPVQALSFLLLVVVLVGSVCSLSLPAIDILCPTGLAQNIASSGTILLATLSSALVLLLLALPGGRIFCGWLCPFGFVLDLTDKAIEIVKTQGKKRHGAENSPSGVRRLTFFTNRNNKYGVLAGSVAASSMTGNQAFCTVCPIGVVCRSYGIDSALGGAELAVIPLVAVMEGCSKRSWCRYFCPVGALFALVARFSPISVEIGAARCKKFSCKRCAEVCPMGIIDGNDLQNGQKPLVSKSECILCMRCVDVCPHRAAGLRFGLPKAGRALGPREALVGVARGAGDSATLAGGRQ
ncbi:MAG: 4Fe-4S binding protein [Desulfovibrio sp.]|jgi:ferredoxin-type protein NapH|nr:4Fe-4S binding protein [Desulfovibrio sp.]